MSVTAGRIEMECPTIRVESLRNRSRLRRRPASVTVVVEGGERVTLRTGDELTLCATATWAKT